MIKLVIFDLDGVLTSTSHEHFSAWKQTVFEELNLDINNDVEPLTKGVSRHQSLEAICDFYNYKISNDLVIRISEKKNDLYKRLILDYNESNLFEGVTELISFLKENDIKVAIGSASKNGPTILKKLKIYDLVDYIVDPSNLKSKPNPDIFLNAMNHFGFNNDECIGIEDSQAGIDAINAAGMLSVGIIEESTLNNANYEYLNVSSIDKNIFVNS